MFKKGQKVVVVGLRPQDIDPACKTAPKNGGIYTYNRPASFMGPEFYGYSILDEFPKDVIFDLNIRPLDEILKEQSETDIKEIEKTINEPVLV